MADIHTAVNIDENSYISVAVSAISRDDVHMLCRVRDFTRANGLCLNKRLIVEAALMSPSPTGVMFLLKSGVVPPQNTIVKVAARMFTDSIKFLVLVSAVENLYYFLNRMYYIRTDLEVETFVFENMWFPWASFFYINKISQNPQIPDENVRVLVNLVHDLELSSASGEPHLGTTLSTYLAIVHSGDDFLENTRVTRASSRVFFHFCRRRRLFADMALVLQMRILDVGHSDLIREISKDIAAGTYCRKDPGFYFMYWNMTKRGPRLPGELVRLAVNVAFLV